MNRYETIIHGESGTCECSRLYLWPTESPPRLHIYYAKFTPPAGPELSMGWVDPWVGSGWVTKNRPMDDSAPDTTRQSSLCRVWHDGVNLATWNYLSPTVSSRRESSSHRRSGRDTDKTVLSRPAWRCELAFTYTTQQLNTEIRTQVSDTSKSAS